MTRFWNCSVINAVLFGLASFIILLLTMNRDVIIYDEGIILTGAMSVADGKIPHRDFYSIYGPLQYYVVSAVLYVSDQSFLAVRIYDAAVKAAICGSLFYLIDAVCRRWIALGFAAACGAHFIALGGYLYPIFPCALLALIGGYRPVFSTGKISVWLLNGEAPLLYRTPPDCDVANITRW